MRNKVDQSLALVKALESDSQLLALLIEVAAFETQSFGRLSDAPVVPSQFLKNFCPFKGRNPLGQWPCGVWNAGVGCLVHGVSGWQGEPDRLGIDGSSGQQQEPLDDIAQFADVARPGVLLERINGLFCERNRLPSILCADLAGKVLDQSGQIFGALTQRRQLDGEDHHAMIEIAPEKALFDELLEVAMGGNQDAHVDCGGLGSADAFDLTLFEHAQQLGLHG